MFDLFVNLSTGQIRSAPSPEEHKNLGGRGLLGSIISQQVPPDCDPFGPENKLILAPGLFAGTGIPSAQRLSIGAKSPLTGGIKESNGGGTTAAALGLLGIKSVIISGRPRTGDTLLLHIGPKRQRLVQAGKLAGLGAYQTAQALTDDYGDNIAALIIGPAGEHLALAACALNLDYQGRPSRANGRGGLGAVMGSKGLKAIVVSPPAGVSLQESVEPPAEIQEIVDQYCKAISESPSTKDYTEFGTALTGDIADSLGCLPTQNFRQGSFVGKDKILGKTIRQLIVHRGGAGNTAHSCVPGCIIACSNVFPDRNGRELVSPLDYEAIASIGSNLCIDDVDGIARLYWLCNDLGIDVIEAGASLAQFMDVGAIPWGDGAAAETALRTAYTHDHPGYLLCDGVVATAKHLGSTRVPAVKNQAFAAFDPRTVKGLGVTYATSAQGADHTAGHTIRKKIDHHQAAGQIELSLQLQMETALYDTLGICFFATGALAKSPEIVAELYSKVTGESKTFAQLLEISRKTLAAEHSYNLDSGLSPQDDRLPDFCYSEQLPPVGTTFDLAPETMQTALSDFLSPKE